MKNYSCPLQARPTRAVISQMERKVCVTHELKTPHQLFCWLKMKGKWIVQQRGEITTISYNPRTHISFFIMSCIHWYILTNFLCLSLLPTMPFKKWVLSVNFTFQATGYSIWRWNPTEIERKITSLRALRLWAGSSNWQGLGLPSFAGRAWKWLDCLRNVASYEA